MDSLFKERRNPETNVLEVTPEEVRENASQIKIVDVRGPDEFTGDLGHIEGAELSTLQTDLDAYLDKLSKEESYVFVCRSGNRSGMAAQMAEAKGIKRAYNMLGGMLAWNAKGFDVVKS